MKKYFSMKHPFKDNKWIVYYIASDRNETPIIESEWDNETSAIYRREYLNCNPLLST